MATVIVTIKPRAEISLRGRLLILRYTKYCLPQISYRALFRDPEVNGVLGGSHVVTTDCSIFKIIRLRCIPVVSFPYQIS